MPLLNPVTTSHKAPEAEREVVLHAIYSQILERKAYHYERKQLADLEKAFLKGKMGIRHFLKSLAVSRVYLDAFYENSSNLKFIETALKHFLGRSPRNEAEIRAWHNILLRNGVGAMVSAIIDSDEYRKKFGSFTVPYWHQKRYESPNDYLENRFLENEHPGDRGWALPTLYWHELHLDCTGGTCNPAWQPSGRLRSV